MAKRKITMTVDEKIFATFKHACKKNAMKVSSKVELMMQEYLENHTPQKSPEKTSQQKKSDGEAE